MFEVVYFVDREGNALPPRLARRIGDIIVSSATVPNAIQVDKASWERAFKSGRHKIEDERLIQAVNKLGAKAFYCDFDELGNVSALPEQKGIVADW